MHWLQTLDVGLFRFINQTLSNPVFDRVMPFASGNRYFIPAVAVAGMLALWKGGARARLCGLMLALIVWPGDSFVCNSIKHAIGRPRPFVALQDVRLPASTGRRPPAGSMDNPSSGGEMSGVPPNRNSMPSSHAANWAAATMILFLCFRRSAWFMLPLAFLVSFSRVYNGVHYPSDVLAGAILGAGYAVAGVWAINAFWQWIGRQWFPLWHRALPSLVPLQNSPSEPRSGDSPVREAPISPMGGHGCPRSGQVHDEEMIEPEDEAPVDPSAIETHWLRLGYLFIAMSLLAGLAYLASGTIQLSGDEAYQWVWSKHPALSYYSKPPLIAYTQWLGTHLWGDTQFGVRFFSPVIGAVLGFLLLRFFAREFNARGALILLLIVTATPLMALGSILMTVDPLSVLFWTAAMVAGWRAVQPDAGVKPWLWAGLWMGFGFLSKYTELFQWLCWAVFFLLWKPARAHLRRPGPYLALLINLLCTVPVLAWNRQHHWVTVNHVSEDAKAGAEWHPTLNYLIDFLGKEAALLNPVFFIAMVWAALMFWRRHRRDPRMVYLFSMGAPLFLAYLLFTFHSSVLPNWIAPSVLPLFCLMVAYWDTRWRLGSRAIGDWLIAGLSLGLAVVVLLHNTDVIQKIAGRPLPPKPDPLTRVRAYDTVAEIVGQARAKLLSEGKPVFIIGEHYGITSLVTFYLPEARTNVNAAPLAYCLSAPRPRNQYAFWPGYLVDRKGQNAIFVQELPAPPLIHGWPSRWLAGDTNLLRYQPQPLAPPQTLTNEFESVTDLGLVNALYHGRVFHTVQLFECRNLR